MSKKNGFYLCNMMDENLKKIKFPVKKIAGFWKKINILADLFFLEIQSMSLKKFFIFLGILFFIVFKRFLWAFAGFIWEFPSGKAGYTENRKENCYISRQRVKSSIISG